MQLTYRGVAYSATNITLNTVDTKLSATYRTQNYTRCRPISLGELPQQNLIYRGVAYTTKQQASKPIVSDKTLALI